MVSHNQHTLLIKPKGRTPADEYVHKGRCFIEGRENSHYVIELQNHSHVRKMAVVSVDGLAVTDGKTASFDSTGFVINPNQTIQISGWILDDKTAAEFVFAKRRDSYGSQTSSSGNEGVIGVAWFDENPKLKPIMIAQPHGLRSQNLQYSVASLTQTLETESHVEPSMGTAFGPSVDMVTHSTSFEKLSDQPTVVQLIYYDNAANLQKMGIKLKERHTTNVGPSAFPGSTPVYCVPPPTWATKKW